jgi:hypothetical protein
MPGNSTCPHFNLGSGFGRRTGVVSTKVDVDDLMHAKELFGSVKHVFSNIEKIEFPLIGKEV